ncbi:MAG TPA: DUF3619 family protein [Casimicrobiaceae bacterium]|nr:DUF3619 family protein [Casimicrobiaceae bacterium]
MTNEQQYAAKLKGYLDDSVAGLKPGVAYRLQQARAAALARLSPEAETARSGTFVPTLAGTGGVTIGAGPRSERPFYAQAKVWIAIVVLLAGAYAWQQWNAWNELEAIEDLDAQILTSDLPIDAYVDRGFQLWLKTPRSE